MRVTAELSLYPLQKEYEASIIEFITQLKTVSDIEIYTHSMSTYVKGECSLVMQSIDVAFRAISKNGTALPLVIKLINRDLPVERGFLNF